MFSFYYVSKMPRETKRCRKILECRHLAWKLGNILYCKNIVSGSKIKSTAAMGARKVCKWPEYVSSVYFGIVS
jgi:hypothetical protein